MEQLSDGKQMEDRDDFKKPYVIIRINDDNKISQYNRISISHDSKYIAAAAGRGSVKAWNIATGKEILNIKPTSGTVWSVCFSADGKQIAVGCSDSIVSIWSVSSGKELSKTKGHDKMVFTLAYDPKGKYLATGGFDCNVNIWDAETGKRVAQFKEHSSAIMAIAFSHDGKQIASGDGSGKVRIWGAPGGKVLGSVEHNCSIFSVQFSPDDKIVGTAGDEPRSLKISETDTGKTILELEGSAALAFHPTQKVIAYADENKGITFWDYALNKKVSSFTTDRRDSMAFSPDGKWFASVGSYEIHIWDLQKLLAPK